MYLKEHEIRCVEFFGKTFTEVHVFLDQYAKAAGLDHHRKFLHNPEGICKVVRIFGEEARCPALLHLYDDYEYFQYYDQNGNSRKTAEQLLFEE